MFPYRSNSSQSSEEASSEEDQKDSEHPPKHNGWTFYNNVLVSGCGPISLMGFFSIS